MSLVVQNSVAVNGSGGAQVSLLATTFSREVEIAEDNATPQGIVITLPSGKTINVPYSEQPFVFGNKQGSLGGGWGILIGRPADTNGGQCAIPATTYCQVRSMTATATSVSVTERN